MDKPDFSKKRWLGVKIMAVSFLVAIIGFLLIVVNLQLIGRVLAYGGITGCMVGFIVHLFAMLKVHSDPSTETEKNGW